MMILIQNSNLSGFNYPKECRLSDSGILVCHPRHSLTMTTDADCYFQGEKKKLSLSLVSVSWLNSDEHFYDHFGLKVHLTRRHYIIFKRPFALKTVIKVE